MVNFLSDTFGPRCNPTPYQGHTYSRACGGALAHLFRENSASRTICRSQCAACLLSCAAPFFAAGETMNKLRGPPFAVPGGREKKCVRFRLIRIVSNDQTKFPKTCYFGKKKMTTLSKKKTKPSVLSGNTAFLASFGKIWQVFS